MASILQKLKHLLTCLVIKRSCGFIAKHQLGVLSKSAGNSHALLFAARKLGREIRKAFS